MSYENNITTHNKNIIDYDAPIPASECLQYLMKQDGRHFQTFQGQLTRTLSAFADSHSMSTEAARDHLVQQLASLAHTTPENEGRVVARWLRQQNGQNAPARVTIPDRDSVIRIGFALALDVDQVNDLLRKGSHDCILSPRNAWDAICLYCFRRERPHEVACSLYEQYQNAFPDQDPAPQQTHSAWKAEDTGVTRTLFRTLAEDSWADDDAFLSEFLLPNHSLFTGYSVRALQTYLREYFALSLHILDRGIADELENRNHYETDADDDSYDGSAAARNVYLPNLRKFLQQHPVFQTGTDTDPRQSWEKIKGCLNDLFDKDPQEAIERMRPDKGRNNGLLPVRTLLHAVNQELSIPDIIKKEHSTMEQTGEKKVRRSAPLNESGLWRSFFDHYPSTRTIREIETQPYTLTSQKSFRKVIVLFHFLNQFWACQDGEWMVPRFVSFYDDMNQVLKQCGLAPLYYGDPFDWLLMRSVRECSICEEGTPLEYLADVISCSFEAAPSLAYQLS